MSALITILLVIHVSVCLLMVLVTLMQLPRSEGLGAAFGGSVTENIFGAQTTHVLAKFTVWLGIAFFAVTLALAIAYTKRDTGKTPMARELMAAPVPAAVAAPSATPAAAPEASATPATAPAATGTTAP